jgi:ribosomal protein S27AE
VELKLKTPWRDGTTHLVVSPLEFMQRLAALVPRPRLHLIRFHGVLAPNAKLRPLVVLQGPLAHEEPTTEAAAAAECEVETVQAGPHRISWARLLKRVFDIDMQHCPNCGAGELKIIAAILSAECEAETVQGRPHRISWARLLKRVFDIDMQYCPNCGAGELKIIAAILERPVIEKILTHLGLDPQPPPKGRAREGGTTEAA